MVLNKYFLIWLS